LSQLLVSQQITNDVTLKQLNSVYSITPYFSKPHFNIILPPTPDFPSGLFSDVS